MFPDPVFISLFLLVFAFFWILVCGLISYISGWHQFSKQNPYPDILSEPLEQFSFCSLQISYFGSYNNAIIIKLYKEGISLSPQIFFRAFHPPIFIHWDQISKIEQGKEFFWFNRTDVYVGKNRFRFYKKAAEAINQYYPLYGKY